MNEMWHLLEGTTYFGDYGALWATGTVRKAF